MSTLADTLQAKQILSARLLRRGARSGVTRLRQSLSVASAVLSAGAGVHAVGVGRKVVAGEITEERCVRIYVVQKLALSLLPQRDLLPERLDGIATDVIEAPIAFAASLQPSNGKQKKKKTAAPVFAATLQPPCSVNRKQRQRPVVPGSSVAHFNVTAGTLASICRSHFHGDDPAQLYLLSNNHVIAELNQAKFGDDVYQPGPVDGGTETDRVATLHRFIPLNLGGTVPNRVDAAIAELLPDITVETQLCSIGHLNGTKDPEENMLVRKHGRTTGYTEGLVSDLSLDQLVAMDHNDPTIVALFQGQMRLDVVAPFPAFALGGDSGALVVEKSSESAVGLFHACPPSGEYGVASPVRDVLSDLQIELI